MPPSRPPATQTLHSIAKALIGSTWLLTTACFLPPLETARLAEFGRTLFGVLAVVHVVECIAFFGLLRKSSRPLAENLWQTFLFGIVHVASVRAEVEGSGRQA